MFVSPLRDTVHHSVEIQSHPWGLQGTTKASGSIDEHMTQTWPIRALHPLNGEIGSGDAKPNPS